MSKFKSIFLVDDDEISNFVCEETIRSAEIAEEVICFSSGDEALDYLQQITPQNSDDYPDLIFLDINMPTMDGWDFLNDFKKFESSMQKNINIVILSSSLYKVDIEKAKQFAEVSEFVSKPLTTEILSELKTKLIQQHQ